MIIKNAASIFDFLTNKLSRFKAFERSKCTKSKSRAVFGPIWDCYNEKNRIVISRSFLRNNDLFLLIEEQNNPNQSSMLICPKDFLNNSKSMYSIYLLEGLLFF